MCTDSLLLSSAMLHTLVILTGKEPFPVTARPNRRILVRFAAFQVGWWTLADFTSRGPSVSGVGTGSVAGRPAR